MLLLGLEKYYGAPPKFVSAGGKMYENKNIVVLKIEKEKEEMSEEHICRIIRD